MQNKSFQGYTAISLSVLVYVCPCVCVSQVLICVKALGVGGFINPLPNEHFLDWSKLKAYRQQNKCD